MILVTLGTQDKPFPRLLKTVEEAIQKGIIQEKVVVQAGCTQYKSEVMEIFDLIPVDVFEKKIQEANLIITHGGVGSILSALQKGKKIIAAPRLSKYKEHTNDHQLELIDEFAKEGYLLPLKDFSKFEKIYQKSKTFHPKKYKSNNKNFCLAIEEEIAVPHQSWYNKFQEGILYLFFGICTTFINFLSFLILDLLGVNTYLNNTFSFLFSVCFAYLTNKYIVFQKKEVHGKAFVKEASSFFMVRILTYFVDMSGMFLFYGLLAWNKIFVKILMNLVVILLNYFASKFFIFYKKERKDG